MFKNLGCYFIALVFFSGCAAIKDEKYTNKPTQLSKTERIEQLSQLVNWQIKGKLAFIQADKRQSATLFWQYDQTTQSQQLNLTTYLGINVLTLKSDKGLHSVEVDGELYQSANLEELIYSLTQLTLPIGAMTHWLKGLEYLPNDRVIYDNSSQLPKNLTSHHNNQNWQISYSNYQLFGQYLLAKRMTIKSRDLTIKIQINQWTTD